MRVGQDWFVSLPADAEFEETEQADLEEGFAEGREALSAMAEGRLRVDAETGETAMLRGEGVAADGQVRVVAQAGGVVQQVEIDPRAMRAGPERLGEYLTEALDQALEQVREHADEAAQGAAVRPDEVAEELAYAEELAMSRLGQVSEGLDDALIQIERFAEEG